MKKRTDKQPAITTLEGVDVFLKNIALNDSFIKEQTALMNQQLISVKEQYEPDIKKKINENKFFEKEIERFLNKNKSMFEKIRSKVLTFGKVGFQRGVKHLSKSKDATWDSITKAFFNMTGSKHVKVKMRLLKVEILSSLEKGDLTEEQIESTGAVIVQKDRPYYKAFEETIDKEK
jgi:hypothetical protein